MTDPLLGTELGNGRYVVERLLGRGTFAAVYACADERLECTVAIKLLSRAVAADPDGRERFVREARFLRTVSDPHVVAVFDIDQTDDGVPYLVMEWCPGGSLADRLPRLAGADDGRRRREVQRVVGDLSAGLRALHRHGVVHRDLKPSNLLIAGVPNRSVDPGVGSTEGPSLLDPGERLVIADLGLARGRDSGSALSIVAGTAGYMAPEQAGHAQGIDGRADLYAASMLVAEVATGQPPSPNGFYRNGRPVGPAALPDVLAPGLRDVLARSLDLDPERRPADVDEWEREVARALDEPGRDRRQRRTGHAPTNRPSRVRPSRVGPSRVGPPRRSLARRSLARKAPSARLRSAGAVGALVVAVLSAVVATLVVRARGSSGSGLPTGAYLVTVRGSAADGEPFDRQGVLRVRADGGAARSRLCLTVGDPFGSPTPGAIWFGSHASCFGRGSAEPLTTVRRTDGETVLIPLGTAGLAGSAAATPASAPTSFSAPTSEPAAATPLPTGEGPARSADGAALVGFTVSTGVTACWFVPAAGELRLRPVGSRISGTVNVTGFDSCGSVAQGTYSATVEAALVSTDPDARVSTPAEPAAVTVAVPDTGGKRYAVANVVGFDVVTGDDAFTDRARARFRGAVFQIDTAAGTFVYAPPDARSDLFPLRGTLTDNGEGVYVAAARRSAGTELTAATTSIGGIIDLSGTTPAVDLTLRTETAISDPVEYRARANLVGV